MPIGSDTGYEEMRQCDTPCKQSRALEDRSRILDDDVQYKALTPLTLLQKVQHKTVPDQVLFDNRFRTFEPARTHKEFLTNVLQKKPILDVTNTEEGKKLLEKVDKLLGNFQQRRDILSKTVSIMKTLIAADAFFQAEGISVRDALQNYPWQKHKFFKNIMNLFHLKQQKLLQIFDLLSKTLMNSIRGTRQAVRPISTLMMRGTKVTQKSYSNIDLSQLADKTYIQQLLIMVASKKFKEIRQEIVDNIKNYIPDPSDILNFNYIKIMQKIEETIDTNPEEFVVNLLVFPFSALL